MTDIVTLINELKVGTESIKQHALQQLSDAGHAIIQPSLQTVVNAEDQHIQWTLEGFDYQGGEGQRSGFNQLQDTVKYDYWYVPAISELLIKLGNSSLPDVIPLLTHERAVVRAWAAYILGAIGDQTAIPPLIGRLNSTENDERIRVIEALGKLKAIEAVQQLIAFLQDEKVDFAAATALGKIGDLRAIMPLIELLKEHKHSVYSATAALYHFGQHAVEPLMQVLLDMKSQKVHDLVMTQLWFIGDKRAIEPILKVLENTDNPKIKGSAIIALGHLKAQQALKLISKILHETTEPDIRWTCAMAIAKIGNREAFDALVDLLENGTPELQHDAALAFGEMGTVENINPILAALGHPDHYVRSAIAVSLGNLRDKRAVDALLKARLTDSDETVRQYAADALSKIEQEHRG